MFLDRLADLRLERARLSLRRDKAWAKSIGVDGDQEDFEDLDVMMNHFIDAIDGWDDFKKIQTGVIRGSGRRFAKSLVYMCWLFTGWSYSRLSDWFRGFVIDDERVVSMSLMGSYVSEVLKDRDSIDGDVYELIKDWSKRYRWVG